MTADREAMTLERQAFEKWWLDLKPLKIRADHGYAEDYAWEAWQAAIAHLSRAAEPVARSADDPRAVLLDQTLRQRAHSLRREACSAWSAVATPCDHIDEAKCQYAAAQEKYLESVIDELADLTHPSEDARDARLFRALVRSFGPEYDLTKGPMHDILLRMHMLPEEEVRHADGSFDFEASIRNVLEAECAIQDAAMKENKDV